MSGERPSIVPEGAIGSLRAREDNEGFIRLPTASEGRFRAGDRVRVNGGVFSGYKGVCAQDGGAERVKVLLEFLGRKTTVLIGDEHLEFSNHDQA